MPRDGKDDKCSPVIYFGEINAVFDSLIPARLHAPRVYIVLYYYRFKILPCSFPVKVAMDKFLMGSSNIRFGLGVNT